MFLNMAPHIAILSFKIDRFNRNSLDIVWKIENQQQPD